MEIMNYKTENYNVQLAIYIFSFSYFVGGINFKDISYLTKENIFENKIVYLQKENKEIDKNSFERD